MQNICIKIIKLAIMELKDFISNSIEQIALGLIDASRKCNELGVIVNPDITIGSDGDYCIPKDPKHVNIQRRAQIINMDISVTVTESSKDSIGGKIGVSCFGIGVDSTGGKNTANENRVKFSIPVCLPVTTVKSE
jgi:hypothetical protein